MICYELTGEDFSSVCRDFRKFNITIEPETSWSYDETIDSLIFNAWSLLFGPIQFNNNDRWLHPSFSIEIASALIHEYQHFIFLKERGMLKAAEEESKIFALENTKQMETLAYEKEIGFLSKALNRNFGIKSIPLRRVRKWTDKGPEVERNDFFFKNNEFHELVTKNLIQQKECILEKFVKIGKYETESASVSRNVHIEFSQLLSLDLEARHSEKRMITFEF